MPLATRLRAAIQALAGTSEYQGPPMGASLDDPGIERARRAQGGQLQQISSTKTRWFLSDLETAQRSADSGDMALIGKLARSLRRDGKITGLLSTRTSGLIALPRKFTGNAELVGKLEKRDATRALFDEMFPPNELANFLGDFIVTGTAVAELLPVVGRSHKVMVRRDPEFLTYRWSEARWYYRSIVGLLPITPGDGRWMLMVADQVTPWNFGLWQALGRAFIAKEHAMLGRSGFGSKLANPAILGYSPPAAHEVEQASWLEKLKAWGYNTVLQAPIGWDAKILETNGRGWEVFGADIETSDEEIVVALTGSMVLVDGGSGFSNQGIHASIRADLIEANGQALAYCINTQGLPAWEADEIGDESWLDEPVCVAWDTAPAADRQAEATTIGAVGDGLSKLDASLGDEFAPDEKAITNRFGIAVRPRTAEEKAERKKRKEAELAPPTGAPGKPGAKPPKADKPQISSKPQGGKDD